MTHPLWWQYWAAAFLIVAAILTIAWAVREWWLWRKDRD